MKFRLWLTGFVGLMGFRPPPEPEDIAVMMPGPDLSGAAPEPEDIAVMMPGPDLSGAAPEPLPGGDAGAPAKANARPRTLGAVVNGLELDVDLSARGKRHLWREPAQKPPEV